MIELTRRAAVALLSALMIGPVRAQSTWPNVTLVVPFPPGGSTDALARILAIGAAQKLHTNVIVENRAGGMGSIGAAHVARGVADGSTFLVTFDSHATIPALVEPPPLDVSKDLEPVLLVGTAPYVIAANTSRPFKSIADVITAAKQKPSTVTYSSAGPGTIGHLAMVLLGKKAGVQMTHVPYKGAGPAIIDTVGGHVDLISASIAILLPQIKAGSLNPLMQMGRVRAAALPDVPTAIESGYPDFEASAWWGIFAPQGMKPDIISKASAAFKEALSQDAVSRQLRETQQVDLTLQGPEDFRKFFYRQVELWKVVIRENDIKAQSN
jgi:tripartite-type tricarboxylate transporter receptor subunit TctC